MSVSMNNITSLMGQCIMQRNSPAMKRSLEKLSTGLRTKTADFDGTISSSENMRARIFGIEKALYSTQDGISLIQTASGALEQMTAKLMRMRELSAQAANDILTQQDRSYIQVEINEIRSDITSLANTTQFDRKKILTGDNAVLWSSTDKQVKAVINGGIRSIDQFGQKYALDVNYKLTVKAEPGRPEIQEAVIQPGADSDTRLRDIDKFSLEQPQILTLTQGDGTQARIMIHGEDTINELVNKLNTAVAVGLGQAKYVDDAGKFVTFTEGADAGTLVIRSALTGSKGEISISGSEELLNALSLNTIQESKESAYNVDVIDAHDGSVIAQNINITGNRLVGVVHKNIDVEFDSMMGLQAAWNKSAGSYSITSTTGNSGTDIILHLADNTMIFQTGAGEGEDVILSLGDMSSDALGLNGVNVMSRERAAKSLDLIDKAIDKVSMQQAKLGAAQNRLENHLGNLTNETEALISANSRIRDIDYAGGLLEDTKAQILTQANSAMLAQSNQLQTNTILSILR